MLLNEKSGEEVKAWRKEMESKFENFEQVKEELDQTNVTVKHEETERNRHDETEKEEIEEKNRRRANNRRRETKKKLRVDGKVIWNTTNWR